MYSELSIFSSYNGKCNMSNFIYNNMDNKKIVNNNEKW